MRVAAYIKEGAYRVRTPDGADALAIMADRLAWRMAVASYEGLTPDDEKGCKAWNEAVAKRVAGEFNLRP